MIVKQLQVRLRKEWISEKRSIFLVKRKVFVWLFPQYSLKAPKSSPDLLGHQMQAGDLRATDIAGENHPR
ncbi:hypothetical protein KRR23_23605 [Pseudomonas sp. CVAP|nr:hypothetical protein [Pseudomonas sp. CVAP\